MSPYGGSAPSRAPHGENCSFSTQHGGWMTFACHQGTAWNHYGVIAPASIAFVSMTNGASAFFGWMARPNT